MARATSKASANESRDAMAYFFNRPTCTKKKVAGRDSNPGYEKKHSWNLVYYA